eukprot:TRINITY_DN3345_c0_g1_i1.p1 TRINITY_DN3345_c0_g1~~TRINITY_DN3345_c0_g1_i1.p1  ORF type:complete len:593 (-),score=67.57 TRINITY_DN3345_c0_g1_i1:156-1832(-)
MLILNRCDISRNDIRHLAHQLPNLEDLQLCNNEISDLKMLTAFTFLKSLDLSSNQISSWQQVAYLGDHIKGLQRLVLSNNPLPEVCAPQGEQFKHLSCLLLGDCMITSWHCINQLSAFPSLKRLRHSRNPVLNTVKGGGRFETIARVAGLIELNNSQVKPLERKDAELRYLSKILDRNVGCHVDQSLQNEHPRLQYLIERYDYFNTHYVHETHVAPKTLASILLSVTLSCEVDVGAELVYNENKENKIERVKESQDIRTEQNWNKEDSYRKGELERISTLQVQNHNQDQQVTHSGKQQSTLSGCTKSNSCNLAGKSDEQNSPILKNQNGQNMNENEQIQILPQQQIEEELIQSDSKRNSEQVQSNPPILKNQNAQNMNEKSQIQILPNQQREEDIIQGDNTRNQRTSFDNNCTTNVSKMQNQPKKDSLDENQSSKEYRHLGSVIKKLPRNLSLRRLSLICQRLFRLDKLKIRCVDAHFVVKRQSDGEMVEIFKESDGSLELQQIGGMDGLEITYVLVDSNVGKLEREQQQQKLGRLAEEQLRRGDRMQALQVAEVRGV